MSSQTQLELHIHLSNGNTHRFVQNDASSVQQILDQINLRIFEQPNLMLSGADTVATYPAASLSGLSIITDNLGEKLLRLTSNPQAGIEKTRIITHDEYRAGQRAARPIVEGQPFVMLSEIDFHSGHRIWIATEVEAAASPLQERQILQHIFSGPALACQRADGGLDLWNRAQMASYTFSPKPATPPAAWPAQMLVA